MSIVFIGIYYICLYVSNLIKKCYIKCIVNFIILLRFDIEYVMKMYTHILDS